MSGKREKSLMMIDILVALFLGFATTGFGARIVPMGNVSIIQNGNVIGEFNQAAPLPEGYLLRCEAKCFVQMVRGTAAVAMAAIGAVVIAAAMAVVMAGAGAATGERI
jgi:hypothetical protein